MRASRTQITYYLDNLDIPPPSIPPWVCSPKDQKILEKGRTYQRNLVLAGKANTKLKWKNGEIQAGGPWKREWLRKFDHLYYKNYSLCYPTCPNKQMRGNDR